MDLEDIKIREINVFLDLAKTHSVRELARQRNIHPGQVSKIISSLERKIGFRLVERSPLGVELTAKAQEIIPLFQEIHANHEALQANFETSSERPVLGFATTSFFSTHLASGLIADLEKTNPKIRIRLLDLPPDLFLSSGMRGNFQICLHLGELDWPRTWFSEKVGEVQWTLCCRKGHPVLKNGIPQLKAILTFPFVFPVYLSPDGISYGQDNFPLKDDKRIRGVETSTATSAVEIMRQTNQFGFVPEIVARPLIESGQLVSVVLPQIRSVKQAVYLSVKSDKVSQKIDSAFRASCRERI